MNSMIEMLESRTLLSAAPVAAPFAAMQTAMSAALTVPAPTSPVGRYIGVTSTNDGTLVIQQWNTTAGTMKFKFIKSNGKVEVHTGTISGRKFTSQFQADPTRITTLSGKVTANYVSITGTYVGKNLNGKVKENGVFSFSR